MKRLEIIVNQSIEADLFEAFRRRSAGSHFTKIPGAMGAGNSDPKMGDHIWPEENVILIIYCGDEEAARIEDAVAETKEHFPSEGLKLFTMNG